MATSRICSIEGCGKPHYGRGWCKYHYSQWHATGDPIPRFPRTTKPGEPMAWLLAHVKHKGAECLIWPFARTDHGYADLNYRGNRRPLRIMCELAHGEAPEPDLDAAHSCGRGADGCIHPEHLRWATRAENEADKVLHGTSNRGERNGCAKLTADDVRDIRALAGAVSHSQLGERFGIGRKAVTKIVNRQRWAWLVDG